MTPLWTASTPIDGTGQTIAIVGETDVLPADWTAFWNMFGVTSPKGTLKIIHNGPDPGIQGDEPEADIDTQWSSAVARGATIDLVVSQTTEATLGVDLSAEFIVDNNLAPVMSESYGICELFLGAAGNATSCPCKAADVYPPCEFPIHKLKRDTHYGKNYLNDKLEPELENEPTTRESDASKPSEH